MDNYKDAFRYKISKDSCMKFCTGWKLLTQRCWKYCKQLPNDCSL